MGGLRKPNQRRRTLHWETLPTNKLDGTFWSGATLPESSEGDAVDTTALESLFTSIDKPKTSKAPGATGDAPKTRLERSQSMTSGRTVVTLLEMKRASNVEIAVSQIKKPLCAIAEAIASMDANVLSSDDAASLLKYIPEPDELSSINQFVSDMVATRALASPGKGAAQDDGGTTSTARDTAHAVGMLGKAEQLFYELGKVPRLKARLQALQFRHVFVQQEGAVRKQLSTIHAATEEIVQSPRFRRLLEIVLTLGNTLNAKGVPARGFRLSSLPKLMDTRSFDNKTTLLHFLVAHLESNPELSTLLEVRRELANLQPASRLLFTTIEEDIRSLESGLAAVQSEVDAGNETDGGPLASFSKEASDAVESCQASLAASRDAFLKCLQFYGEDVAKGVTPDEPERFLGLIHSWLTMLEKSAKERHKVKVCTAAEKKEEEEQQTK